MNKTRQLAAIMFTDIEGYTALMQQDEQHAIKIRTKHRDVFKASTEKYNGEIVQYFGDGTLSVYKSSVEAVKCAIEMQKAYRADLKVPVKIGIHIGDILYSKHDIVGDAVNVAARIESCAVSGSILISDDVNNQIKNHEDIKTKYLHNFQFKNVEKALPIHSVSNDGLIVPDVEELKGKFKLQEEIVYTPKKRNSWLRNAVILLVLFGLFYAALRFFIFVKEPEESSIGIIPFEVLSNDKESKLVGLGLTDAVNEKLSIVPNLQVISKQSMQYFYGLNNPIEEIAKDLHVNYVLQGAVKKSDDKVFIAVQLYNVKKDKFIWSTDFELPLSEIHVAQTEILNEIIDKLDLHLDDPVEDRYEKRQTKNAEAYKLYLQGKLHLVEKDSAYQSKSSNYFKKAIAADSSFAEPYIRLAEMNWNSYLKSVDDSLNTRLIDDALKYLELAKRKTEDLAAAYVVRGKVFMYHDDFVMGRKAFERAIALSPNNVEARKGYSQILFLQNNLIGQLEQAAIAHNLDPVSFETADFYISVLTANQKFLEAEALINKMAQYNLKPIDSLAIQKLNTKLYLNQPDFDAAIPALEHIVRDDRSYFRLLGYSYAKVGNVVNAYKVIDSIKILDKSSRKNYRIAVVFAGLKQTDSTFYYLDTIRNKQSKLLRQDRHTIFKDFNNDEDFKQILKAHGIK